MNESSKNEEYAGTDSAIVQISQHHLGLAKQGVLPDQLVVAAIKSTSLLVGVACRKHPAIRAQIEEADPASVPNPVFWEAAQALKNLFDSDEDLAECGN